jgi:DNA mismatch repair protein MSH2
VSVGSWMHIGMTSKQPELIIGDEAKFVEFLDSLEKDASTIRVFERPGYYSAHGACAAFISQIYGGTVLKSSSSGLLPYCTMNDTLFAKFLKDALLSKALKVEIYSSQGRNGWKLSKSVS